MQIAIGNTPYQYLSQPAKCAIDYLDAQGYGNRSLAKLDAYLEHYFKVYGMQVDEETRQNCHAIAKKRFGLD